MGAMLLSAERSWFDEGRRSITIVKQSSSARFVNTGGIDASTTDAYRQGIELQRESQYVAGLVKISSGEPGMVSRQASFGGVWQALDRDGDAAFVDGTGTAAVDAESRSGVIEPLDIRSAIEHDGLIVHAVRGDLANAGRDAAGHAAPVVTVHQRNVRVKPDAFIDGADSMGNLPIPIAASGPAVVVQPLDDAAQYKASVLLPMNADVNLLSALRAMAPATDSYITPGIVSAPAGHGYDCNPSVGTDSIAFVGRER
jgi:hypothetical protein